jgi:hypothetical protein
VSPTTDSQILELIKMKTNIIQRFNSENSREKEEYMCSMVLEIDIQPNGNGLSPMLHWSYWLCLFPFTAVSVSPENYDRPGVIDL